MIDLSGENVVFVLGAPRSGTTWLAKIFDSHPGVVYRHEPDTVLRSDRVPVICSAAAPAQHSQVHEYLCHLLNMRDLKSSGSLPLFPKRFRSAPTNWLRTLMIYGAKLAARAEGSKRLVRLSIPDFVNEARSGGTKYVLKSVSARGRVRAFSEAFPKSKFVFLLRHP